MKKWLSVKKIALGLFVALAVVLSVGVIAVDQHTLSGSEQQNVSMNLDEFYLPPRVENVTVDEHYVRQTTVANEQSEKIKAFWGEQAPEYFSGFYVGANGLTLLVTCDPAEIDDEIQETAGEPRVNILQVSYSLVELEQIMARFDANVQQRLKADPEAVRFVKGYGIDVVRNRFSVDVYTAGDADARADYAKTVFDWADTESGIVLVESDKAYEPKAAINAGVKDWVTNATIGGISTITCCGTSVNASGITERGFFIAGHAAQLYNQMKIGGTTVGTVSARALGGQMDVAFVHLDIPSSYTPSKSLSTSYSIDGSAACGNVGTPYSMHGMSTGINAGVVNNTSFTFITEDGRSYSNFIRMQMNAQLGDSGGPLVASNGDYSRVIVGIMSSGDGTYSNFTKFDVAASAFNFTLQP